EPGESASYNLWGDFIHLKQDGTVHLKARSKLLVEAPETEFTGNVTIDGNLHINGDTSGDGTGHFDGALDSATSVSDPHRSMQDIHDAFNPHTHGASPGPSTSIP
ncbi:MAG TPA: hypothetical protein VHE37_07500, partial [Nevskiaceae bacterium]|nr:hypothetical protein [Nevskiaceae bacterium]